MNNKTYLPKDIDPCGYHLLLELLEFEEKTKGGIILSSDMVNREQAAMNIGKIIKIGPLAYANHDSGCKSAADWGVKVGDHVQFPTHTFMRVAGEKSNLVFVIDYDIKAKVNLNG